MGVNRKKVFIEMFTLSEDENGINLSLFENGRLIKKWSEIIV